MDTLANSRFDIPGDSGFPLNAVYANPSNPKEAGLKSVLISSLLRNVNNNLFKKRWFESIY